MNLDEKIMQRLLNTFKIEAKEHIQLISNELIKFETETDATLKAELIEKIYRSAHSLKGAAKAVGLNQIVDLCQNIENLFSGFKRSKLKENHQLFEVILKGVNVVSNFVEETDEKKRLHMDEEIENYTILMDEVFLKYMKDSQSDTNDEKKGAKQQTIEKTNKPKEELLKTHFKEKTESINRKGQKQSKSPIESKKIKITEQLRVSANKIENLLIKSEELLPNKQKILAHQSELASMSILFEIWRKKWGKSRLNYSRLIAESDSDENKIKIIEYLKSLLKFIEYNEEFVTDIEGIINRLEEAVLNNYNELNNKLFQLNSEVRSVLMLPFTALTEQFPVMVRDIASQLGKEIVLSISGDSLEIDKRVLDELKDPFVHLLRNALDHGLELPEERIKMNKPRIGKINLSIYSVEGNNVQIVIEDDGKGIDTEKLKSSALTNKIKTQKELNNLSQKEILNLIFESDLSTSKVITDLSGRGLGMAIFKEKIENLSGTYSVESKVNEGTKITLTLPLSVATVRGLCVKAGNFQFYIKTSELIAALRIQKDEIVVVENTSTIAYANHHIGLISLLDVLNIKSKSSNSHIIVVLCKYGSMELGIIVDEVVGEEEILIKSFNKQIKRLKYYEGASITADGTIIPILNVDTVFKSAAKGNVLSTSPTIKEKESLKNILVVDDSITSRVLIKDILENSGYKVKACVDGKEAWTELRQNHYDLVVTDVEMPRVNGFELTKMIKSSEKHSQTPVVLVTGLSKKEDMEKGIDSGANAYIVKSDFEQSNLIQTVERLI